MSTYATLSRGFAEGIGSPRDLLETCLARIEEREPVVRAFAAIGAEAARRAVDRRKRRAGAPAAVSYTHLTLPTICSV